MRNENIRDELNQLPQDFDEERLWQGIDVPKKKQKRQGIFWWTYLGVVILGMGSAIYLTTKASKIEHNLVEESREEAVHNAQVVEKVELKRSSEKSSKLNASENIVLGFDQIDDNKEENKTVILNRSDPTSLTIGNESSTEERDNTSARDNKVTNETIKDEVTSFSKVFVKTDNESITIDKDLEKPNEVEIQLIPNDELKVLEAKDRLITFACLHQLPFSLSFSKKHISDPAIQLLSFQDNISSKFGLTVFSTYGHPTHEFGKSDFTANRLDNERPLESIGIGILGHMYTHNWDIFTGLSFTSHNTHYTFEKEEQAILHGLDNQVNRVTNTSYSLYNSYQFVNLIVGAGYIIRFSDQWVVSPSLQLHYGLNTITNGSLFDEMDQVKQISEINTYSDFGRWQGQVNLTVTRSIGTNWQLGIMVYSNTSRRIAQFENDAHTISSHGAGLTLRKLIY